MGLIRFLNNLFLISDGSSADFKLKIFLKFQNMWSAERRKILRRVTHGVRTKVYFDEYGVLYRRRRREHSSF